MEIVVILIVIGLLTALIGGYFLATHQHTLAMQAASALSRATTIPSGDVAALNAKITGLGTQLNASTQSLGDHVTATIAAAIPASVTTLPTAPIAPPATGS